MKKYIGSTISKPEILISTALKAYKEGYNSLFFTCNESFHDCVHHLYACKKKTGRQVKYPENWIIKAHESCVKKEIELFKLSRKY